MTEGKFYIGRYVKDANGKWVADGDMKSLEDDFGFVRYKAMSGLNSRGKQKAVYTESYAESNSLRVYIDKDAARENITSTLQVCIFGKDPSSSESIELADAMEKAEKSWHSLYDWLEGALIFWLDEYRRRKALFFLQDAVDPTTDNIKNVPYLLCSVKFTNVFGRTFGTDDNTIEDWLKSKGREVVNG